MNLLSRSYEGVFATGRERSLFLPLFTGVRGETVWKILEGFSTVRVWWQKRPVETPLCPLGASPISISGPISIFQTVSLGTWVHSPSYGALDLGRWHHA